MKKESAMWALVRTACAPYGDFVRVENPMVPGTPDVNYSIKGQEGWLELKRIAHWPVRGGIVAVPHWTIDQKRWHIRRREKGGSRTFVLLHVERSDEYMVLDGYIAAMVLGDSMESVLRSHALLTTEGFPRASLLRLLSAPRGDVRNT